MSITTTKTEATENWDDDFDDSRKSPRKIILRQCEEMMKTTTTRTTNLACSQRKTVRLLLNLDEAEDERLLLHFQTLAIFPHSPTVTSSASSVPITIYWHNHSSTAYLRPTSAFAFIPPPTSVEEKE